MTGILRVAAVLFASAAALYLAGLVLAYVDLEDLDLEVTDFTLGGGMVAVVVNNSSIFSYEVSSIEVRVYAGGELILEARSRGSVTVGPGESEYITLHVQDIAAGAILEYVAGIILGEQVDIEVEYRVKARPRLGPIPYPSFTVNGWAGRS